MPAFITFLALISNEFQNLTKDNFLKIEKNILHPFCIQNYEYRLLLYYIRTRTMNKLFHKSFLMYKRVLNIQRDAKTCYFSRLF